MNTFRMSGKVEVFFGKLGYFLAILLSMSYAVVLLLLKVKLGGAIMLFLILSFFVGRILENNSKKLKQMIITEEYLIIKSWKGSSKYMNNDITVIFEKYFFEEKHTKMGIKFYEQSILICILGKEGQKLESALLYDEIKIDEIQECLSREKIEWLSKM